MEGLKETDGTWSLRWIRASNTVRLPSSGMSAANLKRWLKEKKTQNNNGVRATADARWASTGRHQQGHKCVLFSSSVSRLNTLVTTRVTFSLADLLWLKSKFLQKPSRERRALITRLNFQFSHRYAHKHCHTNVEYKVRLRQSALQQSGGKQAAITWHQGAMIVAVLAFLRAGRPLINGRAHRVPLRHVTRSC